MFGTGRALLVNAKRQVREDLDSDPYLAAILAVAALLAAFWFWHRIPNFATRDERYRLFDAVVPIGRLIDDPSIESLRNGVAWGRAPFGATMYLFGLAVLPVVAVAILTGQAEIFASMGLPGGEFGIYHLWADTPRWVWTWSIAVVRLFNVAFAVGCVYLTYRLGTAIADRLTGRLAAIVLTLTFGFLTIAHEGGEDMPALFFILLSLNLLYYYVQSGDVNGFFAASVCGGAAIAFKLTAAPIIPVVGAAHAFRAVKAEKDTVSVLLAPEIVVAGAALGALTICLGFPTLLFVGVEPFLQRVFGASSGRVSHATGPTAPISWWFLRGYVSGLGLPLFVGAVAGVVGSLNRLRHRREGVYGTGLVLLTLGLYVGMFSQWHDFRVHHLLPTFPLLALLLAGTFDDLRAWNPDVARPLMAVLLVTTAVYAGVGTIGYASMPRDQAEAWLVENADENETVEVYRFQFQDTAVPHGMDVNYPGREGADPCPEYIQLGYRDMLYLKDGTYYRNDENIPLYDQKSEYLGELLREERGYTITKEFGQRPGTQRFGSPPESDDELARFVPHRATPGDYTDLLRYGIVPQTDQFADEQELAANQYTVILERTGDCSGDRYTPF